MNAMLEQGIQKIYKFTLMSLGLVGLSWMLFSLPAWAAVDGFVIQHLKASEPVPIVMDAQGTTRNFDATELTEGLNLFNDNCKSCHIGGLNRQSPSVSLSLDTLKAATPARDNVGALVTFQRLPMSYDGSEEVYWCRQVSPNWLSDEQLANLAAFILRSGELLSGWGTGSLEAA
jgi:photosystem II cytochrome c550